MGADRFDRFYIGPKKAAKRRIDLCNSIAKEVRMAFFEDIPIKVHYEDPLKSADRVVVSTIRADDLFPFTEVVAQTAPAQIFKMPAKFITWRNRNSVWLVVRNAAGFQVGQERQRLKNRDLWLQRFRKFLGDKML